MAAENHGVGQQLKRTIYQGRKRLTDHLATAALLVGLGLAGWWYGETTGWTAGLGTLAIYVVFQGIGVLIILAGEKS